jgi:hypothetical protein
MRSRAYLFFTLSLFVGLVAGCGGGDDEESLTKAQFIRQGEAICERQNKKKDDDLVKAFTKLEKEGKTGRKVEEQIISDVALPPVAQMTEELAALGLPAEQEDQARQFIAEMERGVSELEKEPSLALSAEEPFEKVKERAGRFGFSACREF